MKSTLDSTNIICHVTLSKYITEWIVDALQNSAGSRFKIKQNYTVIF